MLLLLQSLKDAPPLAVGPAIRRLRFERAITVEELARRVGMHKGSISKLETGKQDFSGDLVRRIAGALGVTESEIYDRAGKPSLEPLGSEYLGTVPLISWVQAGAWNDVIDNLQPGEGERVKTTYRAKGHTYALRVRGDSMEPKFPDGAIIIVEPEDAPEHGKFVVVRQNSDSEVTFKQLVVDGDRRYLKPLNSNYPLMEMRADAVFCGVVKRVEMDV